MYGQIHARMDPPANTARSSIRRMSGAFSAGSIQGSLNHKNSDASIWEEEALELVNGQPTVKLASQSQSINNARSFPRLPSVRVEYGLSPDEEKGIASSGLVLVIPECDKKSSDKQNIHRPQPLVSSTQSSMPPSTRSFLALKRQLSSVHSSTSSIRSKQRPAIPNFDTLPRLLSNFGQLAADSKLTAKFPISVTVKKLASEEYTDPDSLSIGIFSGWTAEKWWLFLSVLTLFCYGVAALSFSVLTWFKAWERAEVMYIADYDILVFITLASSIVLLTFAIGITGTILNSRPILAVYALLLWPTLICILAIGYTSYKRYTLSLDRKLNLAWSQWYTLRYYENSSPLHEATSSSRCYARSPLPGCKGKLFRFEKANLRQIWRTAFLVVVPLHFVNIFVSMLCANHVTRTFGKGIMPR